MKADYKYKTIELAILLVKAYFKEVEFHAKLVER